MSEPRPELDPSDLSLKAKLIDFGVKCVLGLVFAYIHFFIKCRVREVDYQTGSFFHETGQETFPVILSAIVMAVQFALAMSVIIPSSMSRQLRLPMETQRERIIKEAYRAFMSFATAGVTTLLIIEVIKKYVGKPRPDFLGRCFGDLSNMKLVQKLGGAPCIDPTNEGCGPDWNEVPNLLTNKFCLDHGAHEKGAEATLNDGRASFPSAHSGTAALCAIWVSFAAFHYLSHWRWGAPVAHLIFLMMISVSAIITFSRLIDWKHDLVDIGFGYSIGATMVVLSFKQYYPGFSILSCGPKRNGYYDDQSRPLKYKRIMDTVKLALSDSIVVEEAE